MQVVVGLIGRAHGIRGEVAVDVRSDEPEVRLACGLCVPTEPVERGPLTITGSREHSGRWLVQFAGVDDRSAAEALRGTQLLADTDSFAPIEDPDEFYDHELIGLDVLDGSGTPVGEVADVRHGAGNDLIVVRRAAGGEALVPFVAAIVRPVDPSTGRLVIDPPEGLLDL